MKNYVTQILRLKLHNFVKKYLTLHVQIALQPHESRKLNLVAPEKSDDFSYTIKKPKNRLLYYILLYSLTFLNEYPATIAPITITTGNTLLSSIPV